MTVEEWFASVDAVAMLQSIFPFPGPHSTHENSRTLRLYLAACARMQWRFLPGACRRLVEIAEGHVDEWPTGGEIELLTAVAESLPGREGTAEDWDDLAAALAPFGPPADRTRPRPFVDDDHWRQSARLLDFLYRKDLPPYQQIRPRYHNADTVRDLFALAKRRVRMDDSLRTAQTVGLADAMYSSGTFDRMPVLADALEGAGCEHDSVLRHCRDGHVNHVRGCWVVDLVLGKA